ncbi:TetR/AcrR family transcriptional regulator [Streptomyces sp. NBC_01239]|uniref:TetR/AcrR family transcriptional regulator n=1 Tax=Streptomyces sp. NBC_01239 TaxID=2903792 RepID=UPI00224DA0AA|nr:TetR/AcrR family transcriptional regulator [Streptomyces sp. NBC_01239]MCX4815237.1 TetR/AcrR family transcriptional regulator [Streptomyces sp. NBC_01239]
MPRPPGHGPDFEARRQGIIDEAAGLFARKGYAASSINDLSRAVGLAKGALYYYIGSKENLLIEIQDRVMSPLLARSRQIAGLDVDPLLRMRLLSESLLTTIFHRLDHIWVYEHDYRDLGGPALQALLTQRSTFEQLVSALLTEAVAQGVLRDLEPRLGTVQFLNLHNRTYQWVKPEGSWSAAFLSQECCAILFRGFGAPEHLLSAVEEQVTAFRHAHPGMSLDPEVRWEPSLVES